MTNYDQNALVDALRDENGLPMTSAALTVLNAVIAVIDETDAGWDRSFLQSQSVPTAQSYAAEVVRKLSRDYLVNEH